MASANETETFQHYQVLKRPNGTLWELGRGAMGITYKAFDTNLRSEVALKVINALHLDSETARARFLREARAAAGLRHRNVASVYHLGNDDQSFFYAMEFVDGETVESLVKETGPMPPVDALQIVVQIARALGAAAKQSLVHRDIKPANVMVTREDDEEEQFVVKVIDFGLARPSLGGEGSAHITMGGFVGTPQFASPEQLEEKDLDARSDIYSLGITLWFMLAGRPPFTGPLGSVFIQQLTKDPPWAQLEGTPEPVLKLLAGMLEKEPDKRPQTPLELRRQVEACLRQLPAAERPLIPPSRLAAEETDSLTGTEAPINRSLTWSVGGVLADRYELVELAGEGTNGRVFRALDRQAAGATVAVKILHSDVLASSAERRRIETELEKLRNAPHPYLLDMYALRESADTSFLVGEWVNGFTLVDLLRSRGQLPLPDTLQLVAQAAVVADHAREHEQRRLELSLHQIMTAFEEAPGAAIHTREALTSAVDRWPSFALKLDALGITREAGDSMTWGGDMTLMPAAPVLGRDTQTSIRGFVEGSDLFALGLMVYELLSGAPPAHSQRGGGREARYVALPALNEAANLVLRRALSANPGFASNVDFFKALVDASGLPQTFIDETAVAEDFEVERLPVSGVGAEEAGATLILEDGESFPQDEPATMRGPSAEERATAEAERIEAKRLAEEEAAAERAAAEVERQRVAAEQAEAKRVAAERAEAERQRIATERAEAERLAAEQAEADRAEAERVAAERERARQLEAERREAQRIEAERVAAERVEAQRIEGERLAAERAEAERIKAERVAAEKAEAERIKAERAEAKRLEAERLQAEKAEADRLQAERAAAQKAEADRVKAQKAEAERLQAEKLKAERAEAERLKAERAEAKRLEAERVKAEKAEAKRLQAAQAEAEAAQRREEATRLRDIVGAANVGEVVPAKPGGNKTVIYAAAAGVALLGVIGVAVMSHGPRPKSTPSAEITKTTPSEPANDQPPLRAVVPTPQPVNPPQPEKVAEASPTPEPTVVPVPTPALVEASPAVMPAPTPDSSSDKQEEIDERNDKKIAARNARIAEDKKRREQADAEAERADRLAEEKRHRDAETEADRKRNARRNANPPPEVTRAPVVAVRPKPTEKPKATPAPANQRPGGSFILR